MGCSSCFSTAAIFSSPPFIRCMTSETRSTKSPPSNLLFESSFWSLLSCSMRFSNSCILLLESSSWLDWSFSICCFSSPLASEFSPSACKASTCLHRSSTVDSNLLIDFWSASDVEPTPPALSCSAAGALEDSSDTRSLTVRRSCWCSSKSCNSEATWRERSATARSVSSLAAGPAGWLEATGCFLSFSAACDKSFWWRSKDSSSSETCFCISLIRSSSSELTLSPLALVPSRLTSAVSTCVESRSSCARASLREASTTRTSARIPPMPSSALPMRLTRSSTAFEAPADASALSMRFLRASTCSCRAIARTLLWNVCRYPMDFSVSWIRRPSVL
mmetsp:Transcript_66386/g.149017  ORF Transcript_66386/g.149017 Transcript_66386/m.149017 type:complete len:334 (+) Transcript_66386:368-1369(+)